MDAEQVCICEHSQGRGANAGVRPSHSDGLIAQVKDGGTWGGCLEAAASECSDRKIALDR